MEAGMENSGIPMEPDAMVYSSKTRTSAPSAPQ